MSTLEIDLDELDGSSVYQDPAVLKALYHDNGLSMSEIADVFGVSKGAIQYQMRNHNIEGRDYSEASILARGRDHAAYEITTQGYPRWRSRGDAVAVHRLIAVAEHGFDAVSGNVVHHKNELKWDNRPENLEVMSSKDHRRHHSQGEKSSSAKLTEKQAREVKQLANSDEITNQEVAERYPVSESMVSMIGNGRRWKHLE